MYDQGYPPGNGQQPYEGYGQYNPYQGYSPYPQNNGWYPQAPMMEPQVMPMPKAKSKGGKGKGGSRGAGKPRRGKSLKWQLIKLLLILVTLAGVVVGGYVLKVQSDVRPYVKVFLDNVSVDGIDLSGMTWEEGGNAVWAQAQAKQASWSVRLKTPTGNYKDITAETLGIAFDPSAALEQAWAIGHDTSRTERKTIFELQLEIDRMKESKAEFFSAEQSANTATIDSILENAAKDAYREPRDATITGYDPNNTGNPFSFTPEVAGQELDTAAIKDQIMTMVQTFQSGELVLQPTVLAPQVTVAQLQENLSLRARVVTPIDKHSTEERNNNIRNAFSKINGMVINDGGKFSFNKVVGKRTINNGFFEAFEYNYGEKVTGVGGGVCQASTTVYLAAVQAGMSITGRKAHGTPVSYTDLGKDATVSDTKGREIDFTFKNDSGSKVFLAAHVIADPANQKRLLCEVRVYGKALGNVRYELEAEIIERLPMPTEPEYVEDTKGRYTTFFGEEVTVIEASEGFVVDSYLCTIVDGVQTERKKMGRDTYPNRPARIYVGVLQ